MKQQAYRHGEILLLKIKSLPKGLEQSKSNIIMTGSHGNHHSFDNGKLYLKQDGITFDYLMAKDTTLAHPEHGDKNGQAKIKDGVYQIIKQQEYTPVGLIPVVD